MRVTLAACLGVLLVSAASTARAAEIEGEYVEARTADVFTGPCISNSEVFTTGDEAVMAWKVTRGSWDGVDLKGLCVAAAVRGSTTFSLDQPEEARAVVIVDEKASPEQRDALIAMARKLADGRLDQVAAVKTARMNLKLESSEASHAKAGHGSWLASSAPRAIFWAGDMARIATRPLDRDDHFCGNEVVAYSPLSKAVEVQPAYTLGHEYKGGELNSRWDDPNCRSSFVGHFAL